MSQAGDSTVVPFPQDGRAVPPEHLSPAEAETWKAVIGSRKAGYFGPEIFPVLEAYCATAMICDRIAAQLRVEELQTDLLASYDKMTQSLTTLAEALSLLPEGERADG
jgi:hypothetical protein